MKETTDILTSSIFGIDSYKPTDLSSTPPADFYDQQTQLTGFLPLSMDDLTFMLDPALGPDNNHQTSPPANSEAGSNTKLSRNHIPGGTVAERQQFRADNGLPLRGRGAGTKNKSTNINDQDNANIVSDTSSPTDQAQDQAKGRPGRPSGVKNRPKDVIEREKAEKAQKRLQKQQKKALLNARHEHHAVAAAPIYQQVPYVVAAAPIQQEAPYPVAAAPIRQQTPIPIDPALTDNNGADHGLMEPNHLPASIADAEAMNMPAEKVPAPAQPQTKSITVDDGANHAFSPREQLRTVEMAFRTRDDTPSQQQNDLINPAVDTASTSMDSLPPQEEEWHPEGPVLYTTDVDWDTYLNDNI